jgi:type VI secretion system secreted protein VgrG
MSDRAHASGATDYAQDTRLLAIDTPLGPDKALLISLEGEDVLSRCFQYRVSIETEQSDAAIQSLLGVPVTLWLHNSISELRRPIHGYVRRLIGQGLTDRGTNLYQLEVVPRLWFLSCTSDCRIFQNLSIPEILQSIFADQGLTDVEFRIVRADYPAVEYCVQYCETALDFVSRLMEHLGLFYWHEHSANRHLLVIADRNAVTAQCRPQELTISPLSGTGELQSLEVDCTFRPGRWALNDYDFQSPTKLLQVNAPTTLTVPRMVNHEMYEYPGHYLDQDGGKRLSRLRIELEEAQQRRVFGTGRCPSFDPGRRFTASVTRQGTGKSYLLTEVRHHATDPGGETDGSESSYSNDFVAIPAELPFRPERLTAKPFVHGTQTAVVVGPPGENIHCDQYGRVRVQFHWDRRGQRNDKSSCWMRVAQTRAGSYYGSLVIPHVGHEVLVSFIEGDPDRPVITGSIANALTMPPVSLPDDKTKMVQRDQGDNKIVMQGKSGQEHLSLVSPRTLNHFVGRGPAKSLSAAGSDIIGGDTIPFWKDQHGLDAVQANWGALSKADTIYDGEATLNSGSTGSVNTVSLGKNNTWSVGDLNVWAGAAAKTYVTGQVYQELHGGSEVIYHEYQLQTIYGENTATTIGDNTVTVVGMNKAINVVSNTTLNIGYNVTLTLVATDEIAGDKTKNIFGFQAESVQTLLQTIATKLESSGILVNVHETGIKTSSVDIENNDVKIIQ